MSTLFIYGALDRPSQVVLNCILLLGALSSGALGAFIGWSGVSVLRRDGSRRWERLDRTIGVDVDDDGVRSTARPDEDWSGAASPDEIESVLARLSRGGFAQVRVALRSGHEYTLIDGLFDEQEAEDVAHAIEKRLR
ncbi:MAG: hypothetical protein AB8I08_19940 [Sandaracinaceae bacterium]